MAATGSGDRGVVPGANGTAAGVAGILDVQRDAAVLRVTLNRPESRNPLSEDLVAQLADVFEAYADDAELRVAIVTGAGDKAFAAGGDLKELMAVQTLAQATAMSTTTRAAFQAIRDFPVPVVAALNGDALGGGAEFAVACDMRVAARHCRMGFIQGRLNLSTAWGGASDLIHLVGPASALRLLSRAELLDMPAALEMGLVDAVAGEDEDLETAVARFCAPIIERPAHILRTFKALTREAKNAGRASLDRLETTLLAANWVHDDHWAAVDKVFGRKG